MRGWLCWLLGHDNLYHERHWVPHPITLSPLVYYRVRCGHCHGTLWVER